MKHLVGPTCIGFISDFPENQIPFEVGQDDLFRSLLAELGHTNIIKNFLLML